MAVPTPRSGAGVAAAGASPSTPAPRIADMSHLGRALSQVALECERAPLTGKQFEGAIRVVTDGIRLLEHNKDSARVMNATGLFVGGPGAFGARVPQAISGAGQALHGAYAALSTVEPTRVGVLRREQYVVPERPIQAVRTAASAVLRAEDVASQASGSRRNSYDYGAVPTKQVPMSALDQAMNDSGLRRAITRNHNPLQPPVEAVGALVGRIIAGDVEVIGAENIPKNGRFLLAPTHATMIDGPVWLTFLGKQTNSTVRPMMKSGIGPVSGVNERVLATGGVFTVEPGTGKGDRSLAAAEAMLRKGQAVAIFPEGRLVDNDLVAQLRDGVARLALDTNTPIIPVAIYGTKKPAIHGADGPGVTMIVGKPLVAPGVPASAHNVGVLRDRLQRSLVSLYDQARERWATNAAGKLSVESGFAGPGLLSVAS